MANYIVTDTQLTAIANAIRERSGSSSQLSFPSGFVNTLDSMVSLNDISHSTDTGSFVVTPPSTIMAKETISVRGTFTSPTGVSHLSPANSADSNKFASARIKVGVEYINKTSGASANVVQTVEVESVTKTSVTVVLTFENKENFVAVPYSSSGRSTVEVIVFRC